MEGLLQFFAAFCVAAIFIGALFIICPDGTMSKTVKYVLAVVFMCVLISAAGVTVTNSQIEFTPQHTFSETETEMEIAFARQVYARALSGKNINFWGIEVFTNKLSDGSIVISKIQIKTDSDKQAVLTALEGIDGRIEVEVINE